MDLLQAELEAQKTALEERMRTEYEEQLAAQEAVLAERLATERDSLLAERQKVEEQLQQEMERQLEEKDQQLQTRLEQQKASLDKVRNQLIVIIRIFLYFLSFLKTVALVIITFWFWDQNVAMILTVQDKQVPVIHDHCKATVNKMDGYATCSVHWQQMI